VTQAGGRGARRILFPRDRLLIDPQDRLNLFTTTMALVVQSITRRRS
jgi:hypothetical protein